jgi:hypothetical protein
MKMIAKQILAIEAVGAKETLNTIQTATIGLMPLDMVMLKVPGLQVM